MHPSVRFSGRVAAPGTVVGARLVDPLEAVRAEEVALRLEQVRGGARGAHHVEIAERRRRAPASGSPTSAAWATTARRPPGFAVIMLGEARREHQVRRRRRSPSACAMSSSIAERMMQPARQILAIVAIGSHQPNSFDAASSRPKPWA